MAENLNYKTDSSWCYDNNPDNCKKYGRLYTWDAAMKACPDGWHLPDTAEWDKLVNWAGDWKTAGTKLKAQSPDWNGEDELGFSALPGGGRRDAGGDFVGFGGWGFWWTATGNDVSSIYYGYMLTDFVVVTKSDYRENDNGMSVRCLLD
jgi:uncharacterized protein (TIGR02145 family)